MKRLVLLALVFVPGARAMALSAQAEEFIAITTKLEPVQCEKRKLRREIALAEAENRGTKPLRQRFAALNREPQTARLEKRLAELEPRLEKSNDPQDLAAISRQQREAFYRCE